MESGSWVWQRPKFFHWFLFLQIPNLENQDHQVRDNLETYLLSKARGVGSTFWKHEVSLVSRPGPRWCRSCWKPRYVSHSTSQGEGQRPRYHNVSHRSTSPAQDCGLKVVPPAKSFALRSRLTNIFEWMIIWYHLVMLHLTFQESCLVEVL